MVPFPIHNQDSYLSTALNELLRSTVRDLFDVPTAYFPANGYRKVRDRLHMVGAFRLLIGSDPQTRPDIDPGAGRYKTIWIDWCFGWPG